MKKALIAIALTTLMLAGPTALAQGGQEIQSDEDSGYDDGPVEVTMYHHIYNLLDKVPMNTQPMDSAVPDIARGFTFSTLETPAGAAPVSNPNSLHMFSSPGPVHYNVSLKEPKYHPERGLSYDVQLAGSEATVYWYMSASATESVAESPQAVGAMPQVTVQATVRLGDDIGGNLDDGQIVAQGSATQDVMTGGPGGNGTVTEFAIPLQLQTKTIPKDEGFNLKVEWWQVDQGGVKYMDRQWKLHSGTDYPNRMVWQVANPVRIDYVHPQPIGERKIAIHTAFNTPFGNYDVDLDQLQMTLKGPDGNEISPTSLQGPIITQKSWVHNHHFEPVLATWVWNYRADDAAPGDYAVDVDVANLQGNAVASKAASFNIQQEGTAKGFSSSGEEIQALDDPSGEESDDAPFGALPIVAGVLIATVVAAYRRRS